MPLSYPLSVNDIVARTGVRSCKFTVPGRALVDGGQITESAFQQRGRNRYMVLSLDKAMGQFIKVRPDLPSGKYRQGEAARQFVGNLMGAAADWLDANNFVVVEIEGPLRLDMVVEINTDDPRLVQEIDKVDPLDGRVRAQPSLRGKPVKLTVDIVMVNDQRQTASSRVTLDLHLNPLRNMVPYGGYTALDFGNTSSTLVLSDTDAQDTFEVVQADILRPLHEPAGPVQTALRISGVRRTKEAGGVARYDSIIGPRALEDTDSSWLVLGAKRLLSDRKASGTHEEIVILGGRPHTIPAEDPAEEYISKMLKGLFFHRQVRPQSIAITCPTTFTASEVGRLRRMIAMAYERSLGKATSKLTERRIDDFVPLVIDEASAAAFYFAHQDYISAPGGIKAFRYLYPNGLNLLLYDCGGGTTDLAVVRLEARSDGHLEIGLLGRAGHRRFGGDFITEQVFRILKAKLAVAKAAAPDFPTNPAQIAKYLADHEIAIDRAVPTKYDLRQMQNDDAQRRRRTALDLWRLAEMVKLRLPARGSQAVEPGEGAEFALLTAVCERVGRPPDMEEPDVAAALAVSRREIDALVDPEIDRTIAYANDLIRHGMEQLAANQAMTGGDPPLEIPEVDRVYIVGNASKYPRIRERLLDPEHGLHVRFLDERLAEVRPDDFKNSVAKGAIVALRMARMDTSVRVSWDEDFMNRLPFDLVSESFARAGGGALFARGELYSARLHACGEIAPDPRTGRPTTQQVRIGRRWPGETVPEPCMIFQFAEPIAGRFVLRYDEDRRNFVMHPGSKGAEDELLVEAEPFEAAPYLAPPQSGRI